MDASQSSVAVPSPEARDGDRSGNMERSRQFGGLKFLWDGAEYQTQKEALEKRAEYEKEGFSVQMLAEGGKHYLFTRRVVKDVVVSG